MIKVIDKPAPTETRDWTTIPTGTVFTGLIYGERGLYIRFPHVIGRIHPTVGNYVLRDDTILTVISYQEVDIEVYCTGVRL